MDPIMKVRSALSKVSGTYVRLEGLPVLEGMRVRRDAADDWIHLIGTIRTALGAGLAAQVADDEHRCAELVTV